MKKLKGDIIRTFLLCIILLSVAESALDWLLENILLPHYAVLGTTQTAVAMTAYIMSGLALLALTIWLFSKVTGKKFEREISRQMNERNMLYANITHDLKTPITSILGFSKALKDNKMEGKEKEQAAGIIYQKAKRTDELLTMLFEYTKMETASYQPDNKPVDLCAVLRKVTALHYGDFEEKNMDVEIEIPDSKSMLLCNEQQITRAIENLVINAYRHNRPGSHVGVFLREEAAGISILVADDGREISREEEETVFDPFVSGDASRNSNGGSGLGLAIARKITELYGGSLSVERKEDGYTKSFVIRFPSSVF